MNGVNIQWSTKEKWLKYYEDTLAVAEGARKTISHIKNEFNRIPMVDLKKRATKSAEVRKASGTSDTDMQLWKNGSRKMKINAPVVM